MNLTMTGWEGEAEDRYWDLGVGCHFGGLGDCPENRRWWAAARPPALTRGIARAAPGGA